MKKSPPLSAFALRVGLPAALGIAAASWTSGPKLHSPAVARTIAAKQPSSTGPRVAHGSVALMGTSDEAIDLAAMAGRTAEAKQRFRTALLDQHCDTTKLGAYLAPILIGEPSFLPEALDWVNRWQQPGTDVENRPGMVLNSAFSGLGSMSPRTMESLLRLYSQYPEVLRAFHSNYGAYGILQAGELDLIFEPAWGYSDEEIRARMTNGLGVAQYNPAHLVRILEEWRGGRLRGGDCQKLIAGLWSQLQQEDPAAADRLLATLTPELADAMIHGEDETPATEEVEPPLPSAQELIDADFHKRQEWIAELTKGGRIPPPEWMNALPDDLKNRVILGELFNVQLGDGLRVPGLLRQLGTKPSEVIMTELSMALAPMIKSVGSGDAAIEKIEALPDPADRNDLAEWVLFQSIEDAPQWTMSHLDLIQDQEIRDKMRQTLEEDMLAK